MSITSRVVSALGNALPATRNSRLMILIYHRVHPQPSVVFPRRVDAIRFSWQMEAIRRYCNPVTLADGVRGLRDGRLPPRAVAVTFDDGYADNAEIALPILLHHGIQATFFVATGFLDGGRMWNDSVIEALRRTPLQSLDLRDLGLGAYSFDSELERWNVAADIIRTIKRLPQGQRAARVDELCGRIAVDLPDNLMMTSAQVRQLSDAGMEVGAHTVTHPIVRTLEERALIDEIEGCAARLRAITGRSVRGFAYPNGQRDDDYTVRDRNVVESLGFDYAVSTEWGAATAATDRFQLPRFTPWDDRPARWLARLLFMYRRADPGGHPPIHR